MKVIVGTRDLRQALASVAPHVSPDKEHTTLYRLRCEVGAVNLSVSAASGYTAAHAIVSVIDNEHGEAGSWDLQPSDAKEILALFPIGKGHEDQDTLRLEVDREHVTVTDVSGLFPGKELTLPRLADDELFPDVPGLIGSNLESGSAFEDFAGEVMSTFGPQLKGFLAATSAYSEPLVLQPVGAIQPRLLITCGESFIGLLSMLAPDGEEGAARIRDWRRAWSMRLPAAPTRRNPEPPAGDGDGDGEVPDEGDPEDEEQPVDLHTAADFLTDNVRSLRGSGVSVSFTPATD